MAEPITFKQRGLLESRSFQIVEDGVLVTIRALLFRNRFKVRFEQIVKDPIEFTVGNPFFLWMAALCFTLFGVVVFITVTDHKGLPGAAVSAGFLGAAGALLLTYRLTLQTLLRLSAAAVNLDLYPRKPSPEVVARFIEQVRERATAYLLQAYPTQGLSILEQLERIQALLERGAITTDEFAELKKRLFPTASESSGQYL
jgi:hypothetical protein